MTTKQLAAILAAQLVLTTPLAFADYVNITGSSCAPMKGTDATSVQYLYDRVYNPTTRNIWVSCPVVRLVADQAGALADSGYINVFFGSLASTSATVPCRLVDVRFDLTDPISATTTATYASMRPSRIDDAFFILNNTSTSSFRYLAVRCRLAPKTGIQSIDWEQR